MPQRPGRYRPGGQRNERRPNARQRGYDHRWERRRERFLNEHPLCVECERAGIVTEATVVDHVIPHRGNRELFDDEANWQPLCKSHHDRKTARGE